MLSPFEHFCYTFTGTTTVITKPVALVVTSNLARPLTKTNSKVKKLATEIPLSSVVAATSLDQP